MASVELKHVGKRYGGKGAGDGTEAVKDFNLQIKDEEFVVLVGPSGCGKSTVLRMIAGLEPLSEGELFIGEHRADSLPPGDRNIAMVFQNYALYPHMNVYKNLEFGLKMRKVEKEKARAKILDTAKLLQIEELLLRKPAQLSGGQRQRVALGRAMVREPQVFLLDEPLSNLDALLRNEMRLQISRLHKLLKTTFVYVTHDQTEAMTMADRIVVMKDGVIQQADTPQRIYQHPANLFVAGFIGAPAMNFFPVTLRKKGNEEETEGDGYKLNLFDCSGHATGGRFDEQELKQCSGQEIIGGFRPEALSVRRKGEPCQPGYQLLGEAQLMMWENLGSESYVYVLLNDCRFTVRVPSDWMSTNWEPGQTLLLDGMPEQLHLFRADTGQSIPSVDKGGHASTG